MHAYDDHIPIMMIKLQVTIINHVVDIDDNDHHHHLINIDGDNDDLNNDNDHHII